MLHPATRLGYVHLTVSRLDSQIAFYTQVLGFTLHWRKETEAALGSTTEVLLRLSQDSSARRVQHTTGMYHFAILYPSRKELARIIARLFALRYPNSPTDHGFSKTTYLDDPEGNTIELYVRSVEDAQFELTNGRLLVRYADGRVTDGRDPLDVEALFRELDESDRLDVPLPAGSQLGHVHLYASGLESSLQFYSGVLGFQAGLVIDSFRMGDVGLDEQQPHVVAFNTWRGTNLPPSPANALGMRYFTIVPPNRQVMDDVVGRIRAAGLPLEPVPEGFLIRDPSQIQIMLTEQMLSPIA